MSQTDPRAQRLQRQLDQRRKTHAWRERWWRQSAQGAYPRSDGQTWLSFASNDYLGLAADPRLARAATDAFGRWGTGAGASAVVGGDCELHREFEQQLAHWCQRDDTLLFGSGYLANLAVASCFAQRGDHVFHDRLNHASLLDGARMGAARFRRYPHADVDRLGDWLGHCPPASSLIITDGVFSMDGDIAPLPELAELASQHQAWLLVDDAHGLGVLGEQGRGSLDQAGLDQRQVPVLMGTLSKAFGAYGAFVSGPGVVIDYLRQFARSAIYTTALPPAVIAAGIQALDAVRSEQWRRDHLRNLIARFQQQAAALPLDVLPSATPIQILMVGDDATAVALSARLRQQGILAPAIRPPTVPKGQARLRITLSAAHSEADLERLMGALAGEAQRRAG